MTTLVEAGSLLTPAPRLTKRARSAAIIDTPKPAPFDKKEWRTPVPVFRPWWDRWHFTVDAFASDRNSAGVGDALIRPHSQPCINPDLAPGHFCYACDHAIGRYLTKETNGLDAANYHEGDRVWANPPYIASVIEPAIKLGKELALDGGIPWVLLLPPSVDTKWFRLLWNDRASRWRDGVQGIFPPGRIRFNRPDGTPGDSPRAGNLFVVLYAGGDE